MSAAEHFKISIGACARENTDRPGKAFRIAPRVLQGLPCAFEKYAVLRIEVPRLTFAVPKERGIELIDVLEFRHGSDIPWLAPLLRDGPSLLKLGICQRPRGAP